MKAALVSFSILLSFALYVPLWTRIWRRRTSGDYSLWAYGMILALQVSNLALARLEQAPYLQLLYLLHIGLVLATIGVIWRFYD